MQCPTCRSVNPDEARYCNQCGTFLDTTSIPGPVPQSFKEKFAKIQRYLPQGLTEKTLTQRHRIEGERKRVTVMFCDMEGFMPLVERQGPEAAYAIMDAVYEILIQQVTDFEGTVNEMTGDGIMALFGAPIALEEAPQRALWAAHAIHREITAYNDRNDLQDPIRMRIGVHSGPVIVGTLGNDLRVDFKAVGDTVNLASRMEHMAEPGTTYATRDVFKLARGMFKFEPMGRKVIKGRDESIQVYKVHPLRQDAHRPLLGAGRMIFSEMVGRDDKLDQLDLQLMKLINGTGAVVNIIGEAGIGKSRLIAELKRREAAQRVRFLEGRAMSMGRNLSFHPLIDLLKQWALIGAEDGALEAWDKLEIATQAVFEKQTAEVLPFIATLMGMNLPGTYQDHLQGIEGEALERLIRKNLRELFLRLSSAHPLVIVIDDLHWADKSSMALLESLFRLAVHARILFITLYRPGYGATGERVQQTTGAHPAPGQTTMVLEPLDAGTSQELIANMLDLKGVHHTLIGEIVRRTGGNPYFIEEVVRSFIDEGAVVVHNGKFEMSPRFSQVSIPHTINDVLMARIDRLEEETRDLLKVAAVIGRRFFYRILAEVAHGIRNLDGRLAFLEEIQLIREQERMEEREYLFKHALAQEAAYASILPQKRKRLHLQVAETIEKVFAEKLHAFYGMLAYHYSRGENLDQAEEALIKAGEEALKTSASSEALHYYQEALLLYRGKIGEGTETEKAARLEKNIALALYNRGQFEEALEYFEKALGFFGGRLSHHPVVSAYLLISGLVHLLVGFYLPWLKFRKTPTERDKEVLDLRFKKMKALAIVQPKRFFIESMLFYKRIGQFNLTRIETGLGLFVGASTLFSFSGMSFWLSRKVLNFVNARVDRDDTRSYIICDFSETLHQFLVGNWQAVKPLDTGLIEHNLQIGEVYWASLNMHWHGLHALYRGDLETSRAIVTHLAQIADVYDHDFALLLKFLLNTGLLVAARQLPEALAETEAGLDFAQKNNFRLALIHLFGCQAQIYILMGQNAVAEQAVEQADIIRREMDTVPWQLSLWLKARAALFLCRLQADSRNAQQSVAVAQREPALKACRRFVKQTRRVAQHRTDAFRMLGEYYWLIQQPERAHKWWRKSIRSGRQLGARLELSRTYFEIGRRLLEWNRPAATMDGRDAPAYLNMARELFEAMGLDWDLDRLNRLERR